MNRKTEAFIRECVTRIEMKLEYPAAFLSVHGGDLPRNWKGVFVREQLKELLGVIGECRNLALSACRAFEFDKPIYPDSDAQLDLQPEKRDNSGSGSECEGCSVPPK